MNTVKNNGHSELIADSYGPDLDLGLDELRQRVIDTGVDLSAVGHQRRIAERRAQAARLVHDQQPNRPPEWFQAFERFIIATGNTLVEALMLVLSYVMPPIAILGLTYAEIQRVALGVALFDSPRAMMLAVVMVASFVTLTVIRAGMVARQSDHARPVWSLRLWLSGVAYTLGVGRWKQRNRTDVQKLDTVIGRLGLLIVVLGTAGSMQSKLAVMPGTWWRGLIAIFTESTLIDFLAFMGGFLLTAALLSAVPYTVEYVYGRFSRLVPEGMLSVNPFDSCAADEAANRAEQLYLLALLEKYGQPNRR